MRRLIAVCAMILLASTLQAGDWTGFYGGATAGRINSDRAANGSGTTYGLHGGYDIDYGAFVLGGEVEIERVQMVLSNGAGVLSNVGRVKFRAGRDFGSTLAYAIAGGVSGDTPSGSETGAVYGVGLLTTVGDNLIISGEALRQVFGNFAKGGSDLKTDSFIVRVSFHF